MGNYSEEFTRAQYEGTVWWKERKRSIERDYVLKSRIRKILSVPVDWKGYENYDYRSSRLKEIESIVKKRELNENGNNLRPHIPEA